MEVSIPSMKQAPRFEAFEMILKFSTADEAEAFLILMQDTDISEWPFAEDVGLLLRKKLEETKTL